MNSILGLLSEPNGKRSNMRAMATLVVVAVVGTWSAVSLEKKELQPLSAEHVGLVGLAIGAKVYQRTKEADPKT